MRIRIREKTLFKKLIKRNFNIELNSIDSFCTDSRKVRKNDIFMPIKGSHIDPHNFIPDILLKKPSIIFSEIKFPNKKIVNVKSTKSTLNMLSSEWIKFFKNPIIAITGSNGKTTTKEMLVNIFDHNYKINYTKGNYNSSIGLPVNLFEFCLDANVNIIEMGANKPNEINYLCKIVQPNYSLITNIQKAHIGNFDSFDELIYTKTSIFRNTKNDGIIFENSDDINISQNCKNIKNKIRFGFNNTDVDFFGEFKSSNKKNRFFINGKEIVNSNLNKVMAQNMLASYSIAAFYGVQHEVIVNSFKKFNFLSGRGQHIHKHGYLIIDDTYNANLESFKIGIDSFMELSCKGKKFLIMGDMKELGKNSQKYHIDLGDYINEKYFDFVFSYGNLISNSTQQIKNKNIFCKHFDKMENLINDLKLNLNKGDAIYLKASRSMKFEHIINMI